jgi:hypothetical protein
VRSQHCKHTSSKLSQWLRSLIDNKPGDVKVSVYKVVKCNFRNNFKWLHGNLESLLKRFATTNIRPRRPGQGRLRQFSTRHANCCYLYVLVLTDLDSILTAEVARCMKVYILSYLRDCTSAILKSASQL